jgi:hypothetical protein
MLKELFNDKKTAEVIEFFIIHEKWEQNQKDICEELKIYPRLIKTILQKLLYFKIIKKTRQIAKSKFYKINENSPLIKPFRVLIYELNSIYAMNQIEELNKEQTQNLIKKTVEINHGKTS